MCFIRLIVSARSMNCRQSGPPVTTESLSRLDFADAILTKNRLYHVSVVLDYADLQYDVSVVLDYADIPC